MAKLDQKIQSAYNKRDQSNVSGRYGFYRSEVQTQLWRLNGARATVLHSLFGTSLASVKVLDVGCGTGAMLRQFCEWGMKPENLTGTELLRSRIDRAKEISPVGIHWHLGDLDALDIEPVDLVCANTVFSSLLADEDRKILADQMWENLTPGGCILLFDFKMNNPSNPDVRKFSPTQAKALFPGDAVFYQSLVLAPPISRRLVRFSSSLNVLGELFLPFLRTHYVLAIQKGFR